ncbi:MAG: ABC transporter permease [Oscillospiraceae bacterium]|nr:ABC transporter permease [Oscillospiraceae bacterium]
MFSLYKKELQGYFYSPIAYVFIGLVTLIFSGFFAWWIYTAASTQIEFRFSYFFYYNILLTTILLIPILTMKAFAEERKNGTEVLLLSSPLSVSKIVIAKFLAVATVLVISMVVSFIYPLIVSMYGYVVMPNLIASYVGYLLYGLAYIALGLMVSSFVATPGLAMLLSVAVSLILFFMELMLGSSYIASVPIVSDVLYWFSNQAKFENFTQGFCQLSDLVSYVTEIAVFLLWTIISIEKRRFSRS